VKPSEVTVAAQQTYRTSEQNSLRGETGKSLAPTSERADEKVTVIVQQIYRTYEEQYSLRGETGKSLAHYL